VRCYSTGSKKGGGARRGVCRGVGNGDDPDLELAMPRFICVVPCVCLRGPGIRLLKRPRRCVLQEVDRFKKNSLVDKDDKEKEMGFFSHPSVPPPLIEIQSVEQVNHRGSWLSPAACVSS